MEEEQPAANFHFDGLEVHRLLDKNARAITEVLQLRQAMQELRSTAGTKVHPLIRWLWFAICGNSMPSLLPS